jgi:hypothetical protein
VSELCSSSETEANLETELLAPIELNTMKILIFYIINNYFYAYYEIQAKITKEREKQHKAIRYLHAKYPRRLSLNYKLFSSGQNLIQ